MAGIAESAIVNATAFSLGSWLMSKLDRPNYLAETKRHNIALEKLTKACNKFYEEEVARKDHIAKLEQELAKANNNEVATNRALVQLKKYKESAYPWPKLEDFYKPSEKAKHYETLATGILGLLSGLGVAGTLGLFL